MDKRLDDVLNGREGNYLFPFYWQRGDHRDRIPAQIARWHSISRLIRDGRLYRLGNPFAPTGFAAQQNADYDAWIFVSADQSDAVFTYVQITAEANMKSRRIRSCFSCSSRSSVILS